MRKTAFHISFGILVVLLLLSLFWYQQRMLFIDPCFVAFEIINTGNFVISEHRYGAFFTQLFPLVATYLGLPIQLILLVYSGSFYLLYLLVAGLLGFRWKQYEFAILLVCYQTLMVSDVLFWPNNEVHQGVAWMLWFMGYFNHLLKQQKHISVGAHIGLLLLVGLALSSHLLVVLPLLFLWGFIILENGYWKVGKARTYILVYTGLLCLGIGIKYSLSTQGYYDGQKLSGLNHLDINQLFTAFTNGHSKSIAPLFFSNYWILIPVFLGGIYAGGKQGKYKQLGWTLFWGLSYYGLVCITFPNSFGREKLFYMESEWLAFSMMMATPFVFYGLKLLANLKLGYFIFLLLFVCRFPYWYDSYRYFDQRLTTLETLTDQMALQNTRKVLVKRKDAVREALIMDWGLAVESMVYSSMKGIEPTVTIKVVDANFSPSPSRDSFYTAFKHLPISFLNANYFQVAESQDYIFKEWDDF